MRTRPYLLFDKVIEQDKCARQVSMPEWQMSFFGLAAAALEEHQAQDGTL